MLPLEAWTYGFKMYTSDPEHERYFFCWDEDDNKILIKRGSRENHPLLALEDFALNKSSINEVTVSTVHQLLHDSQLISYESSPIQTRMTLSSEAVQ